MLMLQISEVTGISMAVNYGLDRLRFPSPVPVGAMLRLGANLLEVTDIEGGAQVKMELTFEVQDAPKPACVAEVIFRYYE